MCSVKSAGSKSAVLSLMKNGDTVNDLEVKEVKETHVVLEAEGLTHKGFKGPIILPSREDSQKESEDEWDEPLHMGDVAAGKVMSYDRDLDEVWVAIEGKSSLASWLRPRRFLRI